MKPTTHLDIIEGNARFLIDLIKIYQEAPEAPAFEQMQILISNMERELGRFRQEQDFDACIHRANKAIDGIVVTIGKLDQLTIEAQVMGMCLNMVRPHA